MSTSNQKIARFLANAVNHNSPIPYYIQAKEALRACIDRDDWQPGDRLPGEMGLCDMLGVSRSVIRQALGELESDGLIVKQKGKGTFVAEPKIVEGLFQKLTGFYQDMVERGHSPETQILKQEVVPADSKVARMLGLEPGARVIQLNRLRSIEGEPITFVVTYLPYDLCPDVLEADLASRSLYAFLEKQCGLAIAQGHRTLEAVPAGEHEAELLQVEEGSPLVLLNSVGYLEDGTPLEYYYAFHRGDRSRFEAKLVRVRDRGGETELLGDAISELPSGNVIMVEQNRSN